MHAERAAQLAEHRRDRDMLDLEPAFRLPVDEARADLGRAGLGMDLVVRVPRRSEPEADRLHAVGANAPLAAREELVLFQIDTHALGGRVRAGDAVETVEPREGDADVAVAAHPGGAEGEAFAVDEGVELAAVRRVVVAGVALEGVGVDHVVAGAGADLEDAVGAAVHRVEPAACLEADAIGRDDLGDAAGDGVDDAADGLRAVAQRRRPAHHLDAVDDAGVDRHRVVLAERGHIVRADAALQDQHAEVVEAADDGPVGAGREGRADDARLGLQGIGKGGAGRAGDDFRRHDGERDEGVLDDEACRWRRCLHVRRRRLRLWFCHRARGDHRDARQLCLGPKLRRPDGERGNGPGCDQATRSYAEPTHGSYPTE